MIDPQDPAVAPAFNTLSLNLKYSEFENRSVSQAYYQTLFQAQFDSCSAALCVVAT